MILQMLKPKPCDSTPEIVVLFCLGDDAREAVKHGLDGILVSNHGARQLDGVPATVSVATFWHFSTELPFLSQFWLLSVSSPCVLLSNI